MYVIIMIYYITIFVFDFLINYLTELQIVINSHHQIFMLSKLCAFGLNYTPLHLHINQTIPPKYRQIMQHAATIYQEPARLNMC